MIWILLLFGKTSKVFFGEIETSFELRMVTRLVTLNSKRNFLVEQFLFGNSYNYLMTKYNNSTSNYNGGHLLSLIKAF